MPYCCLADFLEDLSHAGQLIRVEEAASLEGDLARRVADAAEGPALLFGAVAGHDLPVVCNLLAAESRIHRALGIAALDELTDRIARLVEGPMPQGWLERLTGGGRAAALDALAPRKIRTGAVQQIVRLGGDVDLHQLPLVQVFAEETDRAIAGATVLSIEPDSRRPMAGRYDLARIDRARLALGWAHDDPHARLLRDYRRRNEKMPLAVVLGGDPAWLLAAAAPLPPEADLLAAAGLLREKPLDAVACRGAEIDVPAEAEIVIEGYCDPNEPPAVMGSRCGPLGHATAPRRAPVMQVTVVTHRANPIFAAVLPGRPPNEFCTMARAMQRAFLPLARCEMPELVDYDLPEAAAARFQAVVAIRKTHACQAHRAAHRAWSLPALRNAKLLILVDDDVAVRDSGQVMSAVAANVRPGRDVIVERGPADPFDPAAKPGEPSRKMALDATRKLDCE